MEYKNLTTSLLIDRCISKDPLAWAEFVRRFSPLIAFSIKKAIAKYSARPEIVKEEIKDIQQNIMADLWGKNKLGEVKNRESINYWLAIIARNATINHLRARRKEVLISDETFFENLPDKKPVQNEEQNKTLEKVYNILKPKEKIIFKLYFKKNLNLKDISKIMCVPLGTVSSIITRMRKKFKK